MTHFLPYDSCDAAIIGSGPAGLSAATAMREKGVGKVLVLERESAAGGVPRHCGHPPFGLLEFKRVMAGPAYAEKLVKKAALAGVDIMLKASVTQLREGGLLTVVTPDGTKFLKAKRVLIATGMREKPRSARLVSGGRMPGITTTGALQSMFYLKGMIPFQRPVLVGTEIVSFSALLTCRKAGIKPAAMLETGRTPSLSWPFHHAARLLGVPLLLNTKITSISGKGRVEQVQTIDEKGVIRHIDCDGLLFTGCFTPESSLARMSHLEIDPLSGVPLTDRFGRCSDPSYYAAGNILGHEKMSMNCWRDGRSTAKQMIKDMVGKLPGPES